MSMIAPDMGMMQPAFDQQAQQAQQPMSASDLIAQMLELAKLYHDQENNPENTSAIAQVISALERIRLREQREEDAALGVSPAQKYMRRVSA